MNNNAEFFAEKLLQIGAVKINVEQPYTWASGWKSPIYCDNRKVLSYPHIRDFVKSELSHIIFQNFEDADVIVGVATAGIPHGALVADLLKLPFVYVRSEAKKHGMGNQIEGDIQNFKKAVVVEDLISTGKSSLQVVDVVKQSGVEVIGMVGLFTYGFPQAEEAFKNAGVPLHTISHYGALIELLKSQNKITEEQSVKLAQWREQPAQWS